MDGGGEAAVERLVTSASHPSPGGSQQQAAVWVTSASAEKKIRNGMNGTGLFFLSLLMFWFLSVIWKLGDGQINLWPIFASCIFFETVNRVLSSLVMNPSFLPGLHPKNVDNFLNTAVSLLHSTLVAFAGMAA